MTNIIVRRKAKYGDYLLKWEGELSDPSIVTDLIEQNISAWIESDTPSIWIRLQGNDLNHINYFLSNGFKMHRIKNGNILVLNRWIRKYSNTLPPGPFCYIGVGACCIADGKILAIRENQKTGPSPWKIPGGSFDVTKDRTISDTAVRECFEETGIKAKFEYITFQRFAFKSPSLFHQPDIYYIARLTPITKEIKSDKVEIYECKWMDIEEFEASLSGYGKEMYLPAIRASTGFTEHQTSNPDHTFYY
ncbi:nudix hydrolase 8-like isoform X3 [Histomonas meleagridis]|uniref:nudix hydrolase 8-like isoform X3 n=1 Tax=Histomonas meleagridis TaxID=135588 RepID=UPI00355A1A6B|nr:nudix hydrolase 8-like isoform X3 [Histomonas meleagridis]KAH0805318.1 nudix hydrolase 8-like isoform X3 [Histomonas meleagridis]